MALNGGLLGKLIFAQCASKGMIGSEMANFSSAFGEGIVESFTTMNQVITTDVGVLTAGAGVGKMSGLVPNALTGAVLPLMMGQGILGPNAKDLAEGICNATVMHFNAMNVVNTTHTTVALGSGVGKVLGLTPPVMQAAILAKLTAKGYSGTMMMPLVSAFAQGFCTYVMATAIVSVVITGTPAPLILGAPIPSAGVGQGKVS